MQKFLLVATPRVASAVEFKDNAPDKLKPGISIKSFILMKLLFLLTTASCLQVCANGYGQPISLDVKNASLEKVFAAIEKQSIYHFVYTKEEMQGSRPLTIKIKNAGIHDVLNRCLEQQPVTYTIQVPYIIIKRKETSIQPPAILLPRLSLRGKITNTSGDPVSAATIMLKGTTIATASNDKGEFTLSFTGTHTRVIISCIGYETQEVAINDRDYINVVLNIAVNNLDETIVMAYGNTSRRLNTGNISKVGSDEITRQPVSNPLATLQGRVPGMVVTQSTGLPGSSIKIQVRGRTTLDQSLTDDQPLFIIDGVPFAPNNGYLNTLPSAFGVPETTNGLPAPGGLSPFNSINPQDIASIEVLKDADATAIYGSRGANGVVLITTKKGKAGKTQFNFNIQNGFSKTSRLVRMLNTKQYLAMRREAFSNDGVTPTAVNAYDLFVWDTTRNTDFPKLLINGTAQSLDVQGSVSGGNVHTQFLVGGNYRYESTVFPGSTHDKRGSLHFNTTHASANQRFRLIFSGTFSTDRNNLLTTDPSSFFNLPPHLKLYDSSGNLAWNEGGVVIPGLNNPLAYLKQGYSAKTDDWNSNLQLSQVITRHIIMKLNSGYNFVQLNEHRAIPASALNPAQNPVRTATFGTNFFKSWITEPQVQYIGTIFKGKLDVLIGTTWQNQVNETSTITGSGYSNDALLQSLSGAASISGSKRSTKYRYEAFYGRINYNRAGKYIINLTARRDGSSRFGPGKRFANFGSIGGAWLFSNEKYISRKLPFISFGKLRASFGVTGNDKIRDYLYLDTWNPTNANYQNQPGLSPVKLYNPDYHWEKTKKFEVAIDLDFLKDRISFSAAYYRNRSSNQLVQYKIPATTGFTVIARNLPALVQNSGLEIVLTTINTRKKNFSWSTLVNMTIPRNKLLKFPNLGTSSYSRQYVIGQPLNLVNNYRFTGVDQLTGLYTFEDANHDNLVNTTDYQPVVKLDPRFFGGMENELTFKSFRFNLFLYFIKQMGKNFSGYLFSAPGSINNIPVISFDRWQRPGDHSNVQRYTQVTSSSQPAFTAFSNFKNSNGIYSDASFLRVKNVSLSWSLPEAWIRKIHFGSCRIYLTGQNLLTITGYKGGDPETQNYLRLPTLKTVSLGIQFNF